MIKFDGKQKTISYKMIQQSLCYVGKELFIEMFGRKAEITKENCIKFIKEYRKREFQNLVNEGCTKSDALFGAYECCIAGMKILASDLNTEYRITDRQYEYFYQKFYDQRFYDQPHYTPHLSESRTIGTAIYNILMNRNIK